jgi:hypothetical protein
MSSHPPLDPLVDDAIRRAVSELVDAAPLPPVLDDGPTPVPSGGSGRGPRLLLAAFVLVVALVLILVVARRPGPVNPSGVAPGPSIGAEPQETIEPTAVVPASVPAGMALTLATRGDSRHDGSGALAIYQVGGPQETVVLWSPGCEPPGSAGMRTKDDAIALIRAGVGVGEGWCQDGYRVGLEASHDPAIDAAIAASVTFDPATKGFRASVPSGYASHRQAPAGTVTFEYGSVSPEGLLITATGAEGPEAFDAERAVLFDPAGHDVELGGHRAYVADRSGPRRSTVLVQYDDHTVVLLVSFVLDADQLADVAAGLRPADAASLAAIDASTPGTATPGSGSGPARGG